MDIYKAINKKNEEDLSSYKEEYGQIVEQYMKSSIITKNTKNSIDNTSNNTNSENKENINNNNQSSN